MVTHFTLCCQIALLLFTCLVCAADISCRNEEGNPVDWFIIYKLPKYKVGEVGSGVEYMYLDESVARWQMSKYMINTSQGAIANTLKQLYMGKAYMSNSSVYVLYNDGPPDLKYIQAYGHTKAQQLEYLYPRFYNCSVPAALSADLPQLAKLCAGSKPALASDKSMQPLFSNRGEKFISFVKSDHFVDDIYTGWVAQVLDTDLLVESWQTQGRVLPSNCSLPRHAMNIKRIQLPTLVRFQSYYDHSKWCVSQAYEDQVTCLGDLNRERAQLWRGGGLICSDNPVIYKAFRQLVDWYISCTMKLND
ncbi:deoxyribonuclease-2-beta isoform X2 [Oryzias latipes]|uniref:deoxyribonuclease-2-beta isoform X2 n=1 Tax=Oryzias latipes TaxID=8090 RepID=UPI0009DB0FD1|nr:deoxyribonuclease-2-beta isoform X2 [Oryzias latipes]